MFGWICTLVTAFPVGIVATIREWLDLGGYADCSLVSVDVEVQEWRERVTVLFCIMLFSSLEEHAVPQVQHCGDYS
jgi:hypothetical protein